MKDMKRQRRIAFSTGRLINPNLLNVKLKISQRGVERNTIQTITAHWQITHYYF